MQHARNVSSRRRENPWPRLMALLLAGVLGALVVDLVRSATAPAYGGEVWSNPTAQRKAQIEALQAINTTLSETNRNIATLVNLFQKGQARVVIHEPKATEKSGKSNAGTTQPTKR